MREGSDVSWIRESNGKMKPDVSAHQYFSLLIRLQCDDQMPVILAGISDACSFAALSFDSVTTTFLDECHLHPLSPPIVHLARDGYPDFLLGAQLGQERKECLVSAPLSSANDVVRMDDEVHQSVLFHDQIDLLLPQIYRIVIQDVEQRIVLGCGDRHLQNLAVEVRHDGTTSTALRVQMRH